MTALNDCRAALDEASATGRCQVTLGYPIIHG